MTSTQTGGPEYDARIRRAQHLAAAYPFAAEILTFYLHIAAFQKTVHAQIPQSWGNQPVARPGGHIRSELNLVILLPHFPAYLSLLEGKGPKPVAAAARDFAAKGSAAWIASFADFWSFGCRPKQSSSDVENTTEDPLILFILQAFLQPYVEFLGARTTTAPLVVTARVCPWCGARPLLGVMRPEGDGGKRFLVCSFCLQEWEFRRILCPTCGEEAEAKLPVYVAEQLPHIRVEACDTCKFYLRTIDLTKDGNAVPLVDDLAAIPLTLWAQEHGYTRLQPNLLGT